MMKNKHERIGKHREAVDEGIEAWYEQQQQQKKIGSQLRELDKVLHDTTDEKMPESFQKSGNDGQFKPINKSRSST